MSEQRSVTLIREHLEAIRDGNDHVEKHDDSCTHCWTQREAVSALAALEGCPACSGTGLVPSLEGCGTRVQCRACHGTGHAS